MTGRLGRNLARAGFATIAAFAIWSAAAGAVALEDPERQSTTEVAWYYQADVSLAKIKEFREKNDLRVIDIEVTRKKPYRFTAVMVTNTGVYERSPATGFGYAKSRSGLRALLDKKSGRLLDVEPYVDNAGNFRLAYVWIKNTGPAHKKWDWDAFVAFGEVKERLEAKKTKLVHLQSVTVFGVRLWSFIAIKRTGVDAGSTRFLLNATPSLVGKRAHSGLRVLDLERRANGRYDVLFEKGGEAYDLYYIGISGERLLEIIASNGVRITDIEQYRAGPANGPTLYSVALRDNVNAESARLRAIVAPAWNPYGYFGVYAKVVGGPVHVRLAHQTPYQPASTMKLVPHLYVIDRVSAGALGDADGDGTAEGLDEQMTWRSPTGQPDLHACPDVTSGVSIYGDTFRNVIQRGLAESLGRSHEALLDWFGGNPPAGYDTAQWGAEVITERVRQLGLTGTTMYPGCIGTNGKPYFVSSRTTLEDIGWLFEGVDNKTFFPNDWPAASNDFYSLVPDMSTEVFRQIVTEEAGAARSAIVDEFISKMRLEGKPGGLDPGSFPGRATRAWSDHLTLPIKVPGARRDGEMYAVGGLFVNDFLMECHESGPGQAGATQECKDFIARYLGAWRCAYVERYRLAIREAIATWPENPGGPGPEPTTPRCGL